MLYQINKIDKEASVIDETLYGGISKACVLTIQPKKRIVSVRMDLDEIWYLVWFPLSTLTIGGGPGVLCIPKNILRVSSWFHDSWMMGSTSIDPPIRILQLQLAFLNDQSLIIRSPPPPPSPVLLLASFSFDKRCPSSAIILKLYYGTPSTKLVHPLYSNQSIPLDLQVENNSVLCWVTSIAFSAIYIWCVNIPTYIWVLNAC